jgi:hypothetical protein
MSILLLTRGNSSHQYIGCFKEFNPERQLSTLLYDSDKNTNSLCLEACAAAGEPYCGTQYRRECWGGPTLPSQQVDDTNCNYPCVGNNSQVCGGSGVGSAQGGVYISVFGDPSLAPKIDNTVGTWEYQGCWTETTNVRALTERSLANDEMTLEACASLCQGFTYFATEYGRECELNQIPLSILFAY